MGENIYKTMKAVGVGNLVVGIILVVVGISIGVLSIVNGVRLLKKKSNLMF